VGDGVASLSSLPSIGIATRLLNLRENSKGFEGVGRQADPRASVTAEV
jgi:hypothetical protein